MKRCFFEEGQKHQDKHLDAFVFYWDKKKILERNIIQE